MKWRELAEIGRSGRFGHGGDGETGLLLCVPLSVFLGETRDVRVRDMRAENVGRDGLGFQRQGFVAILRMDDPSRSRVRGSDERHKGVHGQKPQY